MPFGSPSNKCAAALACSASCCHTSARARDSATLISQTIASCSFLSPSPPESRTIWMNESLLSNRQRRQKTSMAVVARTIIDGTVGIRKEYAASIAFAIGGRVAD